MAIAANLGFPRIGLKRELKKALESYWNEKLSENDLRAAAAALRRENWKIQQDAGILHIPSNDFSLYDHVLDTAVMVGAIPARFNCANGKTSLSDYFAMARGQASTKDYPACAALEMTKWFDTNYHYMVPELETPDQYHLATRKPVDEFLEAKAMGIHTRPVLLGPVSLLLLSKDRSGRCNTLSSLPQIVSVYSELLGHLKHAGADWVQIDEPCLALDLDAETRAQLSAAYKAFTQTHPFLKILVATYFGDPGENMATLLALPVAAVHVDMVRAPAALDVILRQFPDHMLLSLGLVDGRNVWKSDLAVALALAEQAAGVIGADRLIIAPSCSLLHVPVDLQGEDALDAELKDWLCFARQKLHEVVLLTRAINEGRGAISTELTANRNSIMRRRSCNRTLNKMVRQRVQAITPGMLRRTSEFPQRQMAQRRHLKLPPMPTTTIGSFPQTAEVRNARAEYLAGRWSELQYDQFIRDQIRDAVTRQEEIGLDVLVHGEFERTDMVEFFGERLAGVAVTKNGWVQSYGSRCVKPPIIFGDIYRPAPMTVELTSYAQSLTSRPMKGMLTGPLTILNWSFVRDDQPRSETCRQIALAMRDEVLELESIGIRIIQIDEPTLREGLPLRRKDHAEYLRWAVDCFRLAAGGVKDETQIHTHMCYCEFHAIMDAIAIMDADVISIETARSAMELLEEFSRQKYPNEIGPGVYDIHSPRIPEVSEIILLLTKAMSVLNYSQLWINPDCGLKTRKWEEVMPALRNMVAAARALRKQIGEEGETR
ncbi:MAG: 5-methyltetrahydropteroyltriglutamate--homocysteine S-methyltransferase [Phycisphaerae bacterium]